MGWERKAAVATDVEWSEVGSIRGPEGPEGPVGPAGAAAPTIAASFEFGVPETIWVLQHNLGRKVVDVVTIDINGNRVDGDVYYESDDRVRVEFYYAMAGSATVSL